MKTVGFQCSPAGRKFTTDSFDFNGFVKKYLAEIVPDTRNVSPSAAVYDCSGRFRGICFS